MVMMPVAFWNRPRTAVDLAQAESQRSGCQSVRVGRCRSDYLPGRRVLDRNGAAFEIVKPALMRTLSTALLLIPPPRVTVMVPAGLPVESAKSQVYASFTRAEHVLKSKTKASVQTPPAPAPAGESPAYAPLAEPRTMKTPNCKCKPKSSHTFLLARPLSPRHRAYPRVYMGAGTPPRRPTMFYCGIQDENRAADSA